MDRENAEVTRAACVYSRRNPSTIGILAEARTASAARQQSRALVTRPTIEPDPSPSGRPSAPFLAHMIATARRLPQTCARRRADPERAAEAYGVAARRSAEPVRPTLSRSA